MQSSLAHQCFLQTLSFIPSVTSLLQGMLSPLPLSYTFSQKVHSVSQKHISSNTHSLSDVLFATHDKNSVEQAQKLFHSFMHTLPYTIYHTYIHYCPLTGSTCTRVCMLVMHADKLLNMFFKVSCISSEEHRNKLQQQRCCLFVIFLTNDAFSKLPLLVEHVDNGQIMGKRLAEDNLLFQTCLPVDWTCYAGRRGQWSQNDFYLLFMCPLLNMTSN